MFLDPRVDTVVYGTEATCLGAVDHGAEPRYLNGVVGRRGANMAELGAISRASTLSSISKTARLVASCTSCHSPEHSPSIS